MDDDNDTYNVVSTGDIVAGFEPIQVQQHLVRTMKLKPEQAARFFDQRRVVKKGVSKERAVQIRGQLARLGVVAEVENAAPIIQRPPSELTLSLRDEPAAAPEPLALVEEPPEAPPVDPSQAIPGVAAAVGGVEAPTQPEPLPIDTSPDDSLSPAAIAAAAGAALLGAWVWKFVAVQFGFEFGLIAWAIGGAVGFAAASAGSRGLKAGIVCGVLALGAIVLGKYWAYSAFLGDFQQIVSEAMPDENELYTYYEEERADAAALVAGSGSDDFIRRFMVDRNYTEATDPARVSADELDAFREYTEPMLREMAETSPDFDQWQSKGLDALGEISAWSVIREESGLLDLLFAVLGIGTAFRLGAQTG